MSERIWALIDAGVILNTIVADEDFIDTVRADYSNVVEITEVTPRPGVEWAVHGDVYRPPQPGPDWAWDETTAGWHLISP